MTEKPTKYRPNKVQQLRADAEARLAQVQFPATEPATNTELQLLHELQVHQIELEMQNEHLQQAQDALAKSRDRYVNLYEFAPIGYLTLTREGVLCEMNLKACAMLGDERKNILQRRFAQFITDHDKDRWYQQFLRMKQDIGGNEQDFELQLKRRDGSTFHTHLNCLRLDDADAPQMLRLAISDISKLKHTDEELRIAAIAFCAQEGIFITDAQSVILRVNQAFTSIMGYTEKEAVGQTPRLFSSGKQDKAFYSAMWSSINLTGSWKGEIWNRRKSGEIFPGHVTITAVKDASGIVTHYVSSFLDITPHKQAENALLEAKALADQANNAKSRFLAAASHDLRQPLAALSLYVEVLTKQVPSDGSGLGEKIQGCVNSLSELLNDLLDVSKLDAGIVTPNLSNFPINDLLQAMVIIHSPEAVLQGLRLHARPSSVIVRTDPKIMQRILSNIVSNAIRYTNKGGVLIGCRRHQGKQWIEVWDTGIGIPDDKADNIFEEFIQLGDNARNRGSGLGLAIVDKSAKLLGLQIRVRSRLDRGSMFAIEIPQGQAVVAEASSKSKSPSRSLRIGLVDDNADVLEAFSFALNIFGHEVIAATTGSVLFERLGDQKPDILISDYRLAGGENGLDLITVARAVFGDTLPAILITGDTDPELLRTIAKHRVTVCHKPLKIAVLDTIVREAVALELAR